MMNLIVTLVIVGLFIVLAAKNWKRAIGAGPTILIVGSLVLFGFRFNTYLSDQADKDVREVCVTRVERSIGNRDQWSALIQILAIELPGRTDITTTLSAALDANLPRLSIDDC